MNQIHNTESRLVFARAGGREEWGVIVNKYKVSFGGDEKFLELDSDDGCTIL